MTLGKEENKACNLNIGDTSDKFLLHSYSHGVDDFLEEKGGFWFLPSDWQGEIEGDDTGILDNEWYSFLIGTVKRTEAKLSTINKLVFGGYFLAILLLEIVLRVTRRSRGSLVLRSLSRLVLWNGAVVVIAYMGFRTIDDSNWAKDIKAGKAFQLPSIQADEMEPSTRMKGTLPTEIDILIAPQYASHHLEGYGEVLDHAHPGNLFWKEQVIDHATGFMEMSTNLQYDLCSSLISSVLQEDCRFLRHGEERQWVVMEDPEELQKFCHRSMLSASDMGLAALYRELDSLRIQAQYGRFRGTTMQNKMTTPHIDGLQKMLLPIVPSISMSLK